MKVKKARKAKKKRKTTVVEATRAPVGVLRDSRGRIMKGSPSPNPSGRPREKFTKLGQLLEAVSRVEAEKGKKFLDHFVRLAFKDSTVAVALAKKLAPDLKSVEIQARTESTMPDKEAAAIRKKLSKRWDYKVKETKNDNNQNRS